MIVTFSLVNYDCLYKIRNEKQNTVNLFVSKFSDFYICIQFTMYIVQSIIESVCVCGLSQGHWQDTCFPCVTSYLMVLCFIYFCVATIYNIVLNYIVILFYDIININQIQIRCLRITALDHSWKHCNITNKFLLLFKTAVVVNESSQNLKTWHCLLKQNVIIFCCVQKTLQIVIHKYACAVLKSHSNSTV